MYHLIKVLWQYVVCVINWNNKNSLMLIWTLNYYTYCYIIVSTIFVIKFDSHIFFFFFSRNVQNQKQKNLHMDSLVCQPSSSCSSFNSHYYIFLWTKEGILLHLLVDQVLYKYMHVYPFYYDHMGNIHLYVSLKIPAFLYFV